MLKFGMTALVLALAAGIGILGQSPERGLAASESSPSGAAPVSQSQTDPNRADCGAIRGTDYLSEEERGWFLTYCVDQPVFQPSPVFFAVPLPSPPAPVVARPAAPAVRIACYSSLGVAVAEGDLQNVPLNAFPGEPISCSASVSGSYTSIDWAGGQINGSGPSFVTSFSYRTAPWTIRVQVNWGGNPVIKYVSVTTVPGFGCAYPFCIVR
jgi:hypothetical protein